MSYTTKPGCKKRRESGSLRTVCWNLLWTLCLCWGRCVHKIVRDYVHFVGCMFGGRCCCAIGDRIPPLHSQRLCSNVQIHACQLVNSGHKEGSNERQMSLECTESNDRRGMKMKWQILDAICAYWDRCKITGTAVQHWDHRLFSEEWTGPVLGIYLCFWFGCSGCMIAVCIVKRHEIFILSLSVHIG